MSTEDLSSILWRERDLLELLLFKLEVEQLVLTSGRTHWLAHRRPRGGDACSQEIRDVELLRAVAVDAAAAELGLAATQPARDRRAPARSRGGRSGSTTARRSPRSPPRSAEMSQSNRVLLTAGYQAAQATLLSLTEKAGDVRRRRLRRAPTAAPACRQEPVSMTGTFSSLSSALSALRYNRVAMDVASGNIANAGTTGYARRSGHRPGHRRPGRARASGRRWDGAGDGVERQPRRPDGRPAARRPLARRARRPRPSSTPAPPRWCASRPRSASPATAASPPRSPTSSRAGTTSPTTPATAPSGTPAARPRRDPARRDRHPGPRRRQRSGRTSATRLDALGTRSTRRAAQLADLNKGLRARERRRHRRRRRCSTSATSSPSGSPS